MSPIKLSFVFLLCIIAAITLSTIIEVTIGLEPSANGMIIIAVYSSMYFHIKQYKRKLITKELMVTASIMSLVFFLFTTSISYSNAGITSVSDIDLFMVLIYSFAIFFHVSLTNFLYSKDYAVYTCPECDKDFKTKELKKYKYCPSCEILAIESK